MCVCVSVERSPFGWRRAPQAFHGLVMPRPVELPRRMIRRMTSYPSINNIMTTMYYPSSSCVIANIIPNHQRL